MNEQIEKSEFRRETRHRMTRRCEGWDYCSRAIYMITLVQEDRRQSLLGRLVIEDEAAPPETVAARVEPSELGSAILAHWLRIGEFTPEIKPLYCQLMPDHLHAILEVTRPMAKPLGIAIGGFKTGCEKIYRKLALSPRLFASGFQDSILFREGQLKAMFAYLRDNPRRLAIKRLYPDLFRAARDFRRPLPLLGVEGAFMALGNHFLLDRPLAQVQISRRDFAYRRETKRGGGAKIARNAAGDPLVEFASAAFEEKCEALLTRARRGEVLLSPCVSEGEREIARRAFAENLPLVALRNKGFAPLEKPSGRAFDACAEGRLLMLAPAAWVPTAGEKPMTRRDALVLNRFAQALAGDGAATINYHGATFAEIDSLAREAVRPKARAFGTEQGLGAAGLSKSALGAAIESRSVHEARASGERGF